jgi:hypothetical protein
MPKRKSERLKVREELQQEWVQKRLGRSGILLADQADHSIRMSEALLALAEPMMRAAGDAIEFRATVGLAAFAWNLSMLSELEREKDLAKIITDLAPDDVMDRAIIRQDLSEMIRRRMELFPEVRRVVIDFQVQESDGKMNLNVVSAPVNDGQASEDATARPAATQA